MTGEVLVLVSRLKRDALFLMIERFFELITQTVSGILIFICLRYFIQRKQIMLKREDKTLSLKEKTIIFWIHFLFTFTMTFALLANIGQIVIAVNYLNANIQSNSI